MNRIFKIFGLLTLGMLITECNKDDSPRITPARPHAEVYAEDLIKIEDFLKTHYVVANDPDFDGDIKMQDVEINKLDDTHTVSIWDQTTYPLLSKIVKLYGVDFKVYYLKLDTKTDTDADGDKPCGADKILCSYRGTLLDGTQFDIAENPVEFNLASLVRGWEYIIPEFRAGHFDPANTDGTLNPRNYGSGVMFIPSGLAYFNNGNIGIPGYAPLIFTFNLYDVTYMDQDGDKIPSKIEYVLNEDGTLLDTDGDKTPNLFDADDDNDGFYTINEIKYKVMDNSTNPATERAFYYPYFGAAIDDPLTPLVDESKGIPACGNTDFTSSARVRKHLDSNCH